MNQRRITADQTESVAEGILDALKRIAPPHMTKPDRRMADVVFGLLLVPQVDVVDALIRNDGLRPDLAKRLVVSLARIVEIAKEAWADEQEANRCAAELTKLGEPTLTPREQLYAAAAHGDHEAEDKIHHLRAYETLATPIVPIRPSAN